MGDLQVGLLSKFYILPASIANSMLIDQYTIARTKICGERGSPCLIPLLLPKRPAGEPFTRSLEQRK